MHPRIVGQNRQQRGCEASGSVPRGGGGLSGSGKVKSIPPTTRESKLKTAENAWKPSAKNNDEASDDAQVVKAMEGILNKLTPEKFEEVVDTVKIMPINTTERLSALVNLIFEKAVVEQSFPPTYAQMCKVLSLMSVCGSGNEPNSDKQQVNFRNLIINKCQMEFEKDITDDFRTERLKEIEECTDPEKKQELEAKLICEETKLRKRSLGNIRFIGEFYKLRMLKSTIMMRMIGTLLKREDEESLECLCKLLTTIGNILETQCAQQPKALSELNKYFKIMDKIVHERQTVRRVRFLMMDVIDLRQNSWVPRREDNKPKTKAQVQEQVEFTVDRNKTGNQSGWNPQEVEAEFLNLFKRASNDEIFGWIDANIGRDAKSSKFIRALVTASVESQAATPNDDSSIRLSEDFEEKMKNRLAVVLKYVDGNEMLEMQCIYALQALCVKHQYPPGLLEKCFNAFYDSEVVSEEAFEEWVNSKDPDEQEGKGVCITSVQSFMRWLKEADEEG